MEHDGPVFDLEIRQRGGGRSFSGFFRYGSTATIRDRGRVRKERFGKRAFQHAVDDADAEINLLRGHDFDEPLASKQSGTLRLRDTDEGLSFEARLPPVAEQPSYMVDTVRMVNAGLLTGISPGFRIPPRGVVPDAERLIPDPGVPGVQIRLINAAVLYELSLVTRPAYRDTDLDVREAERQAERQRPVLVQVHRRVIF